MKLYLNCSVLLLATFHKNIILLLQLVQSKNDAKDNTV